MLRAAVAGLGDGWMPSRVAITYHHQAHHFMKLIAKAAVVVVLVVVDVP